MGVRPVTGGQSEHFMRGAEAGTVPPSPAPKSVRAGRQPALTARGGAASLGIHNDHWPFATRSSPLLEPQRSQPGLDHPDQRRSSAGGSGRSGWGGEATTASSTSTTGGDSRG